jgi:hypothetical protein
MRPHYTPADFGSGMKTGKRRRRIDQKLRDLWEAIQAQRVVPEDLWKSLFL